MEGTCADSVGECVRVKGSGLAPIPLSSASKKVRGENHALVRHSDKLQNKLLNFYRLQTKLPSSALLSSELFLSAGAETVPW